MHDLYSSDAFEQKYTYQGKDLGSVWTPYQTFFRVWAPTAEEVTINLYRSGNPDAEDLIEQVSMEPDIQGTWTACLEGNLNGVYYTYLVITDDKMTESCDPYARTTGVNGKRAMVVDLDSSDPEGWEWDQDPNAGKPITDAVIYELHIRDLSMHRSGYIRNKGKFLGLTETGCHTKGGCPTGLEHIRDLGVTHIHLLPVFDFGSSDESSRRPAFNWGYDPMNFNVPEGSYATDPFHGAVRVREMKQMVKAIHDHGLSVVMDVVYNHVYLTEEFSFNQIVPGYFSRGNSNGSCCGNDTASERSMVRKYIVDSVNYWADQYHIDGFRFDLVGLIDTQTIREVMESVHKNHPNVIFYGEGWTMDTTLTKPGYELAIQGNSHILPGFSFFSDTLRDLIRGSVFDNTAPGFVSGALCSRQELEESFMGVPPWASQPYQCVNYVSCHDNNTLFDRISLAAPEAPRDVLIRMNNLAAAFTLLSQGVPFFQAGEEMLRTKPGKKGGFDSNSYCSPDKVNSIKWEDLDKEDCRKTVDFYRGVLRFRRQHPALRLQTREDVFRQVHPMGCISEHAAAFLIEDGDKELYLIFNADTRDIHQPLPEGEWEIHIQEGIAGTVPLGTASGHVHVAPISTTVLVRKKPIDVVAALLWEKDKFLICQRPPHKARGLLWEFVGGKAEKGETLEQALIRECQEELDVTVSVGPKFMEVIHDYPDILIRLTLFHCIIPEGFPKMLEHVDLKWIHPSQTDEYDFCPADTDILKEIKRQYEKREPL